MIALCWLMSHSALLEHHYCQDNKGGATNRMLLPLNLLCCLCLFLSVLTQGPLNAAPTRSHTLVTVMMCPMPSVHRAALLIYRRVSHMQSRSRTHSAAVTEAHKTTHGQRKNHNRWSPVWNSQMPEFSYSLNLPITLILSLFSNQQVNTFHSLADTRLFPS